MALHNFNIPKSYFVGHRDLLALTSKVPNFEQRLKYCALNPEMAELVKLRDDIREINFNIYYKKLLEDFLLENKNHKNWIIRSAFNCEDETHSAFAGNFLSEPIFNASASDLFRSLLRVFSSFFEPQAFLNILSTGLNPLKISYGIIIQVYVSGKISGVGFSRDPHQLNNFLQKSGHINGYTEWVPMGCEALTSGQARTNRCDFGPTKLPGEKLIFINELIQAAHKFEKMLKAPVDFEWTWDGHKIYWLQLRSISSEESRRVLKIKSGFNLSREHLAERFPDIISPMGWSLIKNTLTTSLINFGAYVKIKFTNASQAAYFYQGLIYANKNYYRLKNCKPSWFFLLLAPLLFLKLFPKRIPIIKLLIFHKLILNSASKKILQDWDNILKNNISQIKNFRSNFIDASTALKQMETLRKLGADFFKTDIATHYLREAYRYFITNILVSQNISEKEALKICVNFSDNITLNMYRDLEIIRNSPDNPKLLEEFLNNHGHLTNSWDVAYPVLRENKEALKALLAQKPTNKTVNLSHNISQDNIINNKILSQAIKNILDLARADEQQHFFAGLHVSKARDFLRSLAAHWVKHNILFEEDDIFYLEIEEVEQFLAQPERALKFVARRRKIIWKRYVNLHQIKPCDHEVLNKILQGLAASPGRATGTLYVAQNFNDLALMPKDSILYLRTPNPSFVPWFDHCEALITETGGILSHGFIAARELHVPAVSGIPAAALKTNNLVTVDGNSGEIFLH
jgi:phosphohistidine swiveling domain-containing protein